MVKKFMIAVAAVALLGSPAFAAVQNVKVGGDIKTTSVIRNNFKPTGNSSTALVSKNDSQNVVLSQVGLNIQADLTDNVSTMIRLGNERLWGTGTNTTSDENQVNLDTAYVTMKEVLYAPLTVTVGRQPLVYGNAFLMGDGAHNNEISDVADLTGGVNFDAIKAVLSYDPLTVDLFAAKISEGSNETTLDDNGDANLFGVNVNYKLGDKMSTIVEAYTFVKTDKTDAALAGAGETKADKLYVPGLRVSTNPIEGLNVQLEAAYQFGDVEQGSSTQGKRDVSAYGFQGLVNYALPVLKDMKPVVSAGYTYLSGDKTSSDQKVNSFDSLYEDQNTGRIFDTLGVSSSNIKILNLAAEVAPVQDITAKLSWYNLNLVKKTSYNQKVGNEVDLDVTYAYTEDVKFGVSAGMFCPGKYWGSTDKQDNASQVLTSVAVAF